MPKLLAAKKYPALVDVYRETFTQHPVSGEIVREWHYDDPFTYRCNFFSLKGHAEKFGEQYSDDDVVKLEVKPEDAKFITLSMRFGNLRMGNDETNQYFEYVGNRLVGTPVEYYFNIDAMNPQVDQNGRIVSVEIYGKLA